MLAETELGPEGFRFALRLLASTTLVIPYEKINWIVIKMTALRKDRMLIAMM